MEHEGRADSIWVLVRHGEVFPVGVFEGLRGEAGEPVRRHGFEAAVDIHRFESIVGVGEGDMNCVRLDGFSDQGWVEEDCPHGRGLGFTGRAVVCACEEDDGLSSKWSSWRTTRKAKDDVHGLWRRRSGEESVNGGIDGRGRENQGTGPDAGRRIVLAGWREVQAAQGICRHGGRNDDAEAVASAAESVEKRELFALRGGADLEDVSGGGDYAEAHDVVGHPAYEAVLGTVAAAEETADDADGVGIGQGGEVPFLREVSHHVSCEDTSSNVDFGVLLV